MAKVFRRVTSNGRKRAYNCRVLGGSGFSERMYDDQKYNDISEDTTDSTVKQNYSIECSSTIGKIHLWNQL